MTRTVWVLALAVGAAGCNPCASICSKMAAYARDCGYEVPADEVAACIEAQDDPSADDRAVCREFGGRSEIREQWTCDDVAAYFERGPADDTGSPETRRVE